MDCQNVGLSVIQNQQTPGNPLAFSFEMTLMENGGVLWLMFLGLLFYVHHKWGTEGGNAVWLIGVILLIVGSIACFFLPNPPG